MFHLTNNDYIKILKYYNINIPKKKTKSKTDYCRKILLKIF